MATLKTYNTKRNFKATAEPKGKLKKADSKLRFVVQRHAATRLHYDFRLEMDGVLKSWAVPKGPSLNPNDKRLAMMVEDHPFAYRTFEGTIPKGNYGAGEVEIWDEGTYEPLRKSSRKKEETILLDELRDGSLKFILHGKKLNGEFALVKMKTAEEARAWLLIKHKDRFAVTTKYDAENDTNINSKVTKAVLAKQTRKDPAKKVAVKKKVQLKQSYPGLSEKPKPVKRYASYLSGEKKFKDFVHPMLATVCQNPFDNEDWIFEIKWDGYRAIAEIKDEIKLYSRNGVSFLGNFIPIAEALQQQQYEMVLDGEIVAYNSDGLPDFQTLQHFGENPNVPLIYHVFDLLYLNGKNTASLTTLQRKELLREALVENDYIKYCDHIEKTGIAFFDAAKQSNLEGIIAKLASAAYTEGRRSESWLKIKNHHTEEVVIGGFTEPRGSRKKFGALILGRFLNNKLIYAGHTGTGFNDKTLTQVYNKLKPLIVKNTPFDVAPKTNESPTWVQPKLVCTIKYSELTKDNIFRHPVFMGLRIDKSSKEVTISNKIPPKQVKKASKENSANTQNNYILKADGQEVSVTNQNKIYWPNEGYTKGDLLNYYNNISKYILPYLKDRPENLNRFPNGIMGDSFYHKDAGETAPDWISTVKIFSESNQKNIDYIVCNNKATLLFLANLGCIELNPWNSTVKKPDHPTYLIIDIDPAEKNSFEQVINAALVTKQVLDACGAKSFCKTSGATGLHVFVPMGGKYNYEQVKNFAHLIAMKVTEQLPDFTTLERNLKKRGNNKIYIDYLQNRRGQTIASAYSVRPKKGATVSTPLDWKEVKNGLSPTQFDIRTVPKRVAKLGDIFKPVLGSGVNMMKCLKRMEQ